MSLLTTFDVRINAARTPFSAMAPSLAEKSKTHKNQKKKKKLHMMNDQSNILHKSKDFFLRVETHYNRLLSERRKVPTTHTY